MTDSLTAESMSVGEVAERSGFSVDTLRYYERLGLITAVDRTAGGRRRYRQADLGWLQLVSCLRGTGMPIREMQEFAELTRVGDATSGERRALLERHRERVLQHVGELTEQLRMVEHKIDYYREQEEQH
jgi:DNA-binding transcriptional MerR regulator